ncbi:MAG TPA: hypothetical protein VGO40_07885 [Longimicrobium sp.]|jgi:hypothetical protein|nr:hypothetical protein [Longimicrobium sp.]
MTTRFGSRIPRGPASPAPAVGRVWRGRAAPALKVAARITVIAATLGLAGLGGVLASAAGAPDAGRVAGENPHAAPVERVASQ